MDEAAERFLATTAEGFSEKEGAGKGRGARRVLYLRDISDVSWVRNTYIGFEAAPVSVMYGNVDAEVTNSQDIVKAIEDAHAGFCMWTSSAEEGRKCSSLF